MPFQLRPEQRDHRVDLLRETVRRASLLLVLLIDNGFLQLKKRAVELRFQPTETGMFRLLRARERESAGRKRR